MLRWFYYQISDVKAMEAELNQLAGEGWALDWLCFGIARFQRTDRRDLRYCVEPDHRLPVEREEEAYLQLCADAGWEPVTANEVYRVFASRPGTNPVPLQTDPAVEFEVNWNKKLKDAAWACLSPILAYSLLQLFSQEGRHLWKGLLSWTNLAINVLLVFNLLFWTGQFFYLLHRRRQFRAAAESGEELPIPSRRGAKLRSLMGLNWLLLLAAIALAFFTMDSGGQSWSNTPEASIRMAALPVLRAEDVGLEPNSYNDYLSVHGTSLMKNVYALDWSKGHGGLVTEWYDCPAEWYARVVVNDLLSDFQRGGGVLSVRILHGDFHAMEPADLGFDEAWVSSLEDGYQLLLFREGPIVAYITAPVDFTDPAVLDAVRNRLLEVSVP